jgi:hypothetical protein
MATGELDFTISFVDTPSFYRGAVVKTATGSGVGSSSANGVRVVPRTATGSGSSSSTATYLEVLPRLATGSGQGTTGGGATGLLTAKRTATGFGIGSSTVVQFWGRIRIASGSGTGTSLVLYRSEMFRTATGSGNGAESASGRKVYRRTGTGSGAGTQSLASFYKVLFFRPPTDDFVRWAEFNGTGLGNRLFRFVVPGPRGRNVYKLTDSSFTEAEQRDLSVVSKVYYGGHDNPITQSEKDELIGAGYGDYVT